MAEAKHKYFLVQKEINRTVSPANNIYIYPNSDDDPTSLRYIGKYRKFTYCEGFNDVDSNRGNQVRAYNFQLLFGPDEILPDNQGTGASQFIGQKFNWKNTVISLQYDPSNYVTFMRRINGQSYGQIFMPAPQYAYTTPAHMVNVDLDEYQKQSADDQIRTGIWDDATRPIAIRWKPATYQTGKQIVTGRLSSSQQEFTNKGISIPATVTTETQNNTLALSAIEPSLLGTSWNLQQSYNFPYNQFPLLHSPQFKLYYYTRIMVFKFKLPMANFNTMYHSWEQQMNFLNDLWWQRNVDQTRPNYSIRSSVLNDNNPYGGTFQVVYNKLIKINPTKRYIFRFNFGSGKRKGDLITLKTGDPFNPVPDAEQIPVEDHIYSNGCYLGFMLPPIHPDDFDYFGANMIEGNYPWNPYSNNTHKGVTAAETPTVRCDPNCFDGPYLPVYNNDVYTNHNIGQTLNLGSIYLSGRTCFVD